jgi:hypothetical protein
MWRELQQAGWLVVDRVVGWNFGQQEQRAKGLFDMHLTRYSKLVMRLNAYQPHHHASIKVSIIDLHGVVGDEIITV